jgi:hypothetical protein
MDRTNVNQFVADVDPRPLSSTRMGSSASGGGRPRPHNVTFAEPASYGDPSEFDEPSMVDLQQGFGQPNGQR